MQDNSSTIDGIGAALGANNGLGDAIRATGVFTATCRDKDGNVLWEEQFHNLLTTVGKNLLLDEGLAGSAYTATEYMGLISSVSYSALAAPLPLPHAARDGALVRVELGLPQPRGVQLR